MIFDYDLTPRAARDIAAGRDWYESRELNLGDRFMDAVLQAVRRARENPERFSEVMAGIRAVGCRRFPYRVYYETLANRIVVRAVYHTSRDPNRWADEDRD